MSDAPNGWTKVSLGEISRVVRGITFPASSKEFTTTESNVCCLRTTNIQKEIEWRDTYFVPLSFVKRDEQILRSQDILMSMANSYELVGKVAIARQVPYKATFGAFLAAIRPEEAIDGKYLFHLLRSNYVQNELRTGSSQTVNIANISINSLSAIEIPIAPLAEQKRIADKLDTLLVRIDACRERLDRLPGLIKRFRHAVLEAAVTGQLTAAWREAHCSQEDADLVVSALSSAHEAAGGHKRGNAAPPTEDAHDLTTDHFPPSWRLVELKVVVDPSRPVTYGILKPGPEFTDGVPYVRVADFPDDRLQTSGIRKTSPSIDEEFKRSRLRPDDILLSIRGTVGRVVLVPDELSGANITQDTARLAIQGAMNTAFVVWYLRSQMAQLRMSKAIKGVAVRGINIGDVRALQIPVPPRAEQDEIVRRIAKLMTFAERLDQRLRVGLARVTQLPAATLAKAFRGELVPQDPNDEHARALLDRLNSQPGQRDRPKKGRRTISTATA